MNDDKAKQNDLDLKTKLAEIAAEKEEVRKRLAITATELATTAKDLATTAAEKEEVRKELAITAEKLATVAAEKEEIRRELAITAEKLAVYTTGLEVKGVAQTAELVKRVEELETLNKSMVGRELKMIELKKEVAELKNKKL